jgi:hypothetical protein
MSQYETYFGFRGWLKIKLLFRSPHILGMSWFEIAQLFRNSRVISKFDSLKSSWHRAEIMGIPQQKDDPVAERRNQKQLLFSLTSCREFACFSRIQPVLRSRLRKFQWNRAPLSLITNRWIEKYHSIGLGPKLSRLHMDAIIIDPGCHAIWPTCLEIQG